MTAAANVALDVVCIVLSVYFFLLLARVVLSWLELAGVRPPLAGPGRALYELMHDLTDPVLRPLRNLIPPVRMGAVGFDLSIIIVFVALAVARRALRC
ncbi:MAG TPA: YggT family protein [Actinomycetota bacterium]|nr:YggT family protein [Actinomycetota bacterium]